MTLGRWLAVAVLVFAAVYAWTGGPYSQANYTALRHEEIADSQLLQQLKRTVDSLRSFRDSLENSPVVQERIAREQWGMQRPGELTFTIEPDSSPAPAPPGKKVPK